MGTVPRGTGNNDGYSSPAAWPSRPASRSWSMATGAKEANENVLRGYL